ncbi:hypothetical protein [Streptomyces sp. NPDC002994]|uniref:hypothetical protein n=1 Tax=Streptomyces sp. NPDC002994 TaxID=3154441 RepID=UPI0033B4901F
MISEPEMVGDFPAWPEAETATSEDRPVTPRGHRPWLWAVGGAVAASAVWAGGLYTYGRQEPVDTRGYQVGEGLCEKAEPASLFAALGGRPSDPTEMLTEHSALDKGICSFTLQQDGQQDEDAVMLTYDIGVVAELHKKADPEAEFEAVIKRPVWEGDAEPKVEEVPGLGEKAYLTADAEETGELRLNVLDGGAVFEITVSSSQVVNSEQPDYGDVELPEPDMTGVPALMIEDLRDLMTALKR